MRRLALVLNSIVVIFFACFLGYTFFARQHLEELARHFVTEKTLQHADGIVDAAEGALDVPLVKKLVSEEHTAAIRQQIADYRQDPRAYVSDLTRQAKAGPVVEKANPLLSKVAKIKESIRQFYDDTLSALIKDLRIFSFSNLLAGAIAFGLAWRSSTQISKLIVWFSILMFLAVVYCTSVYVDDLTFFRILFHSHLGWGYTVLLALVVGCLYVDFVHPLRKKAQPSQENT